MLLSNLQTCLQIQVRHHNTVGLRVATYMYTNGCYTIVLYMCIKCIDLYLTNYFSSDCTTTYEEKKGSSIFEHLKRLRTLTFLVKVRLEQATSQWSDIKNVTRVFNAWRMRMRVTVVCYHSSTSVRQIELASQVSAERQRFSTDRFL